MESIATFDQFLIDLERRIREDPALKKEIILDAIRRIGCPYLRDKFLNEYGIDHEDSMPNP